MRKISILGVAVALVASACSLGAEVGAPVAEPGEETEYSNSVAVRVAEAPGHPSPAAIDELPFPPEVRVIHEGRLEMRVEAGSFDRQWDRLRRIALDEGGYLSDAHLGLDEADGRRYAVGTVTVRIPAARFDAALTRLSDLGERISLGLSSQEVSEEFVDLEARLRHWRAVEAFHLGLLERATTVEEALKVQAQLQQVQLAIEQIEGRLRYLEARTSFATLTVVMTEAPVTPTPRPEPGELAEALDQARRVLITTFGLLIVAAAAAFPLALLGWVVYLLWRLGRRLAPTRS